MATTAEFVLRAPPSSLGIDRERRFYSRLTLGLALFIVLGFAQFQARGMVDVGRFPWFVHAHALSMIAWLALTVAQPRLSGPGRIALHRRLGWAAMALLAAILVFGSMTGLAALRLGFVPPFFTPAYFLALVHVGLLAFAGTVLWAVARRRRTDWHRRLMIGATVLIMEPALGRLLPMPLLGAWGEWLAMAVQLAALGILARHDLGRLGRVHPATLASAGLVVATHVAITGLAVFPPFVALAAAIAAG